MSIISTARRNARCTDIANAIDANGGGKLQIWSGTRPAGPGSTPSGTKLAEITLNNPSFDAPASGAMALDVSPAVADSSADASGTASFARFVDGAGTGVMDISVGTSGAELNFPSLSFVAGTAIGITSYTHTEPAGT